MHNKIARILFLLAVLLTVTPLLAGPVNINNADADTLAAGLTGIGETKAKAIVSYRQQHGRFESVEQLQQVSGIGERIIEQNRADIILNEK